MKQYQQLDDAGANFSTSTISFPTGHRFHDKMLMEVAAGDALVEHRLAFRNLLGHSLRKNLCDVLSPQPIKQLDPVG